MPRQISPKPVPDRSSNVAAPRQRTEHPLRQPFWVLMLVMSIILFTGAWLYPPTTFGGVETLVPEKILGVQFQYMLWLMLIVGLCLHIARNGFDFMARVLVPWLPFFLAGVLAAVLGVSPFVSFRILVLWVMCVIAAVITVAELPMEVSQKVLFRTLAVLTVMSVLVALAIPSIGQHISTGGVWRGVYTNKNALGWIATLTMIVAAGTCTRTKWKMQAFIAVLAAVCVFKSGSKGALVSALVTLGYLFLVNFLRNKVTPALGVTCVLLALSITLIFGFAVLPELLKVLGKDPTFTGRTFVWSMYFNSMINTPFFGEGPGSYTYLSELTLPLAIRLVELGAIVTPHNAFLGAFGDAGIVGLLGFAGVLIYLGIVAPFIKSDRATLICAGVAFFNMAHGMVETHEVFTPGFAWMMMVFLRGLSLRQQQEAAQASKAQAAAIPLAAVPKPGTIAPVVHGGVRP